MKLILLRHGKTRANEERLYCGSSDLPLSERGREELRLKREATEYPSLDGLRVITSGMRRCEETLSLLFGDTPHETDARLREMDFGRFELHSYEQLKNDPDYIAWISGDNEANIAPGGESGVIMTARALAALNELTAEGRDTLIVTHGGIIAAIMARLFPEEARNRYEWQPKPGGGYIIELNAHTYKHI